ncbi:G-D-S-L family lipolytic protein [Mediterraneibacter sp. NSJ-55]|uniref:G-D-S-L family lipolytic protein n=1 Tax=Mediterraneibacter hominis TaxID=2763054 RepID=A0A923RSB5_9FIRM|nr:GDSL-type esterase/lipase family protein [Mediterraneibacter hominis]MBC5689177.1 G-D-S-L family lipolytic protein [Mediterraneibacter hominis]
MSNPKEIIQNKKVQYQPLIKPGYLSQIMRADERRMEFDCKNQIIVQKNCKVDIVFIGDSIIQMWELSAYFQDYPLRILNRGIGGDRTVSLLHRFRADAVQLKPKIVVIMAGINDSWDLEFDYWKQETGKSLENVLQEALLNMEKILTISAKEQLSIALCSLLPTCMEWTNHEKDRQKYIWMYNQGLEKLSKKYNTFFVDYYPLFLNKDGHSMCKELSLEGLHPNVFGYDKMTETLKNTINFNEYFSDNARKNTFGR